MKQISGDRCDQRRSGDGLRGLVTPQTRQVRAEKFSWISRKTLIESRNDLFAKHMANPVPDERARWMEAISAAGLRRTYPDLVVDRANENIRSFLIVGDPGEGDESQMAVANAIGTGEDDAFMYIISDVIYPSGDVNEYPEKFYFPYEDFGETIYAIPGNHDWYDGLEGFMYHFCGLSSLPRIAYRSSSLSLREWLTGRLWRKPSRSDRRLLNSLRSQRPPWNGQGGVASGTPAQPGPYFAINLKEVMLVGIDTGITGKVDHDQGAWLVQLSGDYRSKPKVLLTGKPLIVNGELDKCDIEWGRVPGREPGEAERKYPTVFDIVRDPDFNYVASVGGDVHNYQRFLLKDEGVRGGCTSFFVSGGGGAYTSITHDIPPVDLNESSEGVVAGEGDSSFYPDRGLSLAVICREMIAARRSIGWSFAAVLILGLLAVFVWGVMDLFNQDDRVGLEDGWGPGSGGLITAIIAAGQLGYSLILRRSAAAFAKATGIGTYENHKADRFRLYSLLTICLAALLFAFGAVDQEMSENTAVWIMCAATVLIPVVLISISPRLRSYSILVGFLLLLALISTKFGEEEFEGFLRVAAIVGLGLSLLTALFLVGNTRTRPLRVVLIPTVTAVVLGPFVFRPDFSLMVAIWVGLFLVALVAYAVFVKGWILFAPGLEKKLMDADEASVAAHANCFLAVRDLVPLPADQPTDPILADPDFARLFDFAYPPPGSSRGQGPFHSAVAEIFDRDAPPMTKNFLRVRIECVGENRNLVVEGHAVTGEERGVSELIEVRTIPLGNLSSE